MLKSFLRFIRRPIINEQNTGRYSYQQYQGYALAGINGNGGQGVRRTVNAINPATIVPGNSLVRNDPTVTGNPNTNLVVQPLSEDNSLSSF
jgi:hypothetical protein